MTPTRQLVIVSAVILFGISLHIFLQSQSAPVLWVNDRVGWSDHHCASNDSGIHEGFWRHVHDKVNDDSVEWIEVFTHRISSVPRRDGTRVITMTLRLKLKGQDGFYYHLAEGFIDDETCQFDLWRLR